MVLAAALILLLMSLTDVLYHYKMSKTTGSFVRNKHSNLMFGIINKNISAAPCLTDVFSNLFRVIEHLMLSIAARNDEKIK